MSPFRLTTLKVYVIINDFIFPNYNEELFSFERD